MRACVTGGAGYVGALTVEELLAAGHEVTVLDSLIHGQEEVAQRLEEQGARIVDGDVRDGEARAAALTGADAVVHLAAIVGDPACARDPGESQSVNVDGSRELVRDAASLGVARLLFASTCSNYGRMADGGPPIDERAPLKPVSLYAEQKVAIERELLGRRNGGPAVTCLRFATVYGVAERMRFDLTVNEFTRDLWAGRQLDVFGELFWRPYVHVRDAARAIRHVLETPVERVSGRVYNVGRSDENYRKLDLVEVIVGRLGRGDVRYVHRAEDPRDYRVSFERIRDELGFVPGDAGAGRRRRGRRGAREPALQRSLLPSLRERRMTRVLMLGPVNHPHVEHLALAMQERGMDVIAAGDSEPTLPSSLLPDAGIRVLYAPGRPRRTPAGGAAHVRWIRALNRELRPDVVHAHWMCGYAAYAALAGASPLVAMAWGSDVLRADRIRTFASRIALRRAGVAMADSQALVDRLVELGARPESTAARQLGRRPRDVHAGERHPLGAAGAARARARAGDPQPALADAGLQPRHHPGGVRPAGRGAARRAARAQAHGRGHGRSRAAGGA